MLIILQIRQKLSTLTRALANVLEIFPIHFLWIKKRNLMQIFLRDSANINKIKLQSKNFTMLFRILLLLSCLNTESDQKRPIKLF